MLQYLLRFRRCTRGVTAVEFAFIAPVLCLIVMGIVEVAMIMFAQTVMESAIFQASRTGKTGYVESGQTQQETIEAAINRMAGLIMDTNQITLTSKYYDNFSNVEQAEPFVDLDGDGVRDEAENYTDTNMNGQYDEDTYGVSGTGSASQIVLYTATYPWAINTPLVSQFFNNGTVTITARTVIRNEPY